MGKSGPAPAGPQFDPRSPQPPQPCPQQRRTLHRAWKHPARGAREHILPQPPAPVHHLRRPEIAQHRGQFGRAVIGDKGLKRLILGDVQPAFPRHQKFSRGRGFGFHHQHTPPGLGQFLGGHQPSGPRPDHQSVKLHLQASFARHVGDRAFEFPPVSAPAKSRTLQGSYTGSSCHPPPKPGIGREIACNGHVRDVTPARHWATARSGRCPSASAHRPISHYLAA